MLNDLKIQSAKEKSFVLFYFLSDVTNLFAADLFFPNSEKLYKRGLLSAEKFIQKQIKDAYFIFYADINYLYDHLTIFKFKSIRVLFRRD
jgi:hypothetical protein